MISKIDFALTVIDANDMKDNARYFLACAITELEEKIENDFAVAVRKYGTKLIESYKQLERYKP